MLKYISRAGKKEGESELKDLEKAKVYLERKILKLKEKQPDDKIAASKPDDHESYWKDKELLPNHFGISTGRRWR